MQDSIIQRAQVGDQRAFQQLVEEYDAVVWRTARVLLSDHEAAQDAIQEAWMDTWRGLPRFKQEQPFRPWLLTIVANRCRMIIRRRRIPMIPIENADEDTLITTDDISKAILNVERENELRSVLGTLPAEQKRVLELRFFAELELTEIALVMNIPTGTVKSRLHRALSALRTSNRVRSLA